jgi:anti-anti-sigma regulatory factor
MILCSLRSVRDYGGSSTVSVDSPISVGVFDGFSWIRLQGKGSFQNSPALRAFGDARIAAGENRIVVDLAACTGMDSTFMGTLAGLAARLSAIEGGGLMIAEPGERNRRSLEDLGLDFLMEIDPPSATWRGRVDDIRGALEAPQPVDVLRRGQLGRHVLEAHENLASANDRNSRAFAGVVTLLEKDLSEREKSAKDEPGA